MFESSAGPNAGLVGRPAEDFARNAATPALCIDLDGFSANLAAMQALASAAGKALRPHMKAHKCGRIAALQQAAGAIGISCATAKEAEAAAAAGISSILLTTPLASPMVLGRIAELASAGPQVILVVDTVAAADLATAAATAAGTRLGVLIDINVGQNRTGVSDAVGAVTLARHVATLPTLRLLGVQAYYGNLQHIPTLAERERLIAVQLGLLSGILDSLQQDGHAIGIVSGGGTGTAEIDLKIGPFTEIQAGSYLFMDDQYLAIERRAVRLEPTLTVLTRVTSDAVAGQVVIDAGAKALSTDPAKARLAGTGSQQPEHRFMGDEHSALRYVPGAPRPAVGQLLSIIATHCDPTVNLHDRFHIMQDGRLIDIWPLDARGY